MLEVVGLALVPVFVPACEVTLVSEALVLNSSREAEVFDKLNLPHRHPPSHLHQLVIYPPRLRLFQ